MMHKGRVFSISDVSTPEDLAEKLTQHTWTGCTGFRLGKLLFLNDATCADGAQEYAVIMDGLQPIQVESITFSWCNYEKALELIRECMTYAEGKAQPPIEYPVTVLSDHGAQCHLCA
jgi:hypothetical protein